MRFWACHFEGPESFHEHVRFWQRLHKPSKARDNRQLWVGAISKDIGLIPIRHNAQITHMVDPNTDIERELIVESLRIDGQLKSVRTIKVGAPYELRNRTIGGLLRTDGKMAICTLKELD